MEGSNAWWLLEGFNVWWPLEGFITWWPLEASIAWWPLERSNVWWSMEGKGKTPFHLFPLYSQQILLKPSFFPLILNFYFIMVLNRYLCISFFFLDLLITTMHLNATSFPHIRYRFDFIKDLFSFP
jgi:hypothetical protein